MPLPLTRRSTWIALVLVAFAVLREWNIRRNEASIAEWPRAGRDGDVDQTAAPS